MFITDTVDALHRPDDWRPESLMDQLAQVTSGIPDTRVGLKTLILHTNAYVFQFWSTILRRLRAMALGLTALQGT